MLKQLIRGVFVVVLMLPVVVVAEPAGQSPGDCPNDSKLIGAIRVSTADASDTWWGITKAGLEDAGIPASAFETTIEGFFGTTFPNLAAAIDALVDPVRSFDENGNGYVCAFSLRGRRAYIGDPLFNFYTFGVTDDKVKN